MPSNSTDAFLIAVDVRQFSWIRRLAADYAFHFDSLASFFAGNPTERSAWTDAIARTRACPRRHADIAAVVARQQARRGAPPRAQDAGRLLGNPDTVAIVTGQQAGLFGGPLFTLFKALTALKLARQVSRDHGVPAVAVFWIEGEDHDWDEVRSCTVLDADLEPRTVSLPQRPGSDPISVAATELDASVAAAIDELGRLLPATEFQPTLLAELRRAYAPGVGMTEAFGRWMEQLFGDRGLIVYDASDRTAKPLVSHVFARELETAGTTAQRAATAGAELVARGFHAQAQAAEDAVALFHLDGARRPIRREDGRWLVGDRAYSTAELREQAVAHPDAFSPNVLLRPIVQDTLFPTICYVSGPNELAYLGQLGGVYEHFGVPMPLMYPRASATLVDSAALRFLTKYQLPIEALQPQDESALNRLLEAQIPAVVDQSLAGAAQAIERAMRQVVETAPLVDPTLEGAAKSTLTRMQHDLDTLRGKVIQGAKRRNETLRRQYMRARALAFPHGQAQERTLGIVSFLNQYGPALVERLDGELPLDLGHHWVVAI